MIPLKALQGQVKFLMDDLRDGAAVTEPLRSELAFEYEQARAAQRTAGTFESWLEDVLDQAAVAWVLGCVFVRFCEDNKLVRPLWIGGPLESASAERAVQARQSYLIANPTRNDRHWLREAFSYLGELRATGKIFDKHNPVWRFDVSGRAAEALSDFFRRGDGFASTKSPGLDTRFLGDLYQDLSVHAREAYALLQTPNFVEEFILDRTFEPAYKEFGLAAMNVIDPTCGSGHFLLGAFDRLIKRWKEHEPATDVRELVQRALDQVTGVDINAFAVAIARFRLMIAALTACGLSDLETAPKYDLRLATGDSLLEWGRKSRHQGDLLDVLSGGSGFAYATEDADALAEFLEPGTYAVVVGNPPYITVKDKALNQTYRENYPRVCHRQYQLTVPFAERFFGLARHADEYGQNAGWVGQITGNAFIKREFGKKLIDDYFANSVELIEVLNTSGAYIPGHGTPTVILIGKANDRKRSNSVRIVFSVRGEPSQPTDPAQGVVWKSIVGQVDSPGSESAWISVADVPRAQLSKHPWGLAGGGASQLRDKLSESSAYLLSDVLDEIGSGAVTREDNAYLVGDGFLRRHNVPEAYRRQIVEGDVTRDWLINDPASAIWPYSENTLKATPEPNVVKALWPSRRILSDRVAYGSTQLQRGLSWYEYSMFFPKRYRARRLIAWGEISSHNHFVLDFGGRVFSSTATVIKLPDAADDNEHHKILGVLNSSTTCFWLKQVCFPKGGSGMGRGIQAEDWMERFAFNASNVEKVPLPPDYPLELGRTVDDLAHRLAEVIPVAVVAAATPNRERLDEARVSWESVRAQMIAAQEELDWEVYRLFGLRDSDLTAQKAPELRLGERAFEIALARRLITGQAETQWFVRHGSTPITELPAHWPAEYRALVERRIAVIESDRNIALIERPECKRRWATKGWDAMQTEALRDWLLDRLEAPALWGGAPTPLSVAQLADRVRHDDDFRSVLDLWVGSDQHDLVKTLGKLIADEHVPYLPAQRYKPAGLRKRVQWERAWELQRREDAGEKVEIAVPPKYASADFLKASYWRNRGKLDVPKERFVSYPKAGRDGDATELLGWAGWDHLAQAQALATVYLDRKTQANWPKEKLLPLLAGLAELEPWLKQWHADPRPGFPGSPAQFFTGFIDTELAVHGADRDVLTGLRGLGKPSD